MKTLIAIMVSVTIVSCGETNSVNYADSYDKTQKDEKKLTDSINDAKEKASWFYWKYSSEDDKMTNQKIQFLEIKAKDILNFEPPYDGGSMATFTARKKDGKIDFYLKVSKGQFNGSFDGGTVKIKFDSLQPKTYYYSQPSDGSTDAICLNSGKDILEKLKSAKTMIIEAEFYDNGTRQMEFNVDGFELISKSTW